MWASSSSSDNTEWPGGRLFHVKQTTTGHFTVPTRNEIGRERS
jgi:hypothetical protein